MMGKEQQQDKGDGSNSKSYVLKVDMHCECTGCMKKISDAIKEMSLSEGVERADLVAETGEVKAVGTMSPERFCRLLHEATKKSVKIVTGSSLREGRTAVVPQKPKNLEAPEEARVEKSGGWPNGRPLKAAVTPSAPPLPAEEDWSETERCWYRRPAPASSTLGVWAPSDVTGTLAMYEL